MKKYKPEFFGKVMPVDDSDKLTDFVANKYDAFTKIYDACKDQSENITDVKNVSSDDKDSLAIKVSTDKDSMSKIIETSSKDESLSVDNDVITAKVCNT